MKYYLSLLLCLFFCCLGIAQDNIILQSGDELEVKITEVSEQTIKYKKLNFLEGPNFTINTTDIFMIKYSNGEKQMFKNIKTEESIVEDLSNTNYSIIQSGTTVPLYSTRTIQSKDLQVGSLVEFRVKSAILDQNGYVLIKANEIVLATVNSATKAKALGKQGSLSFLIQNIKAVDGQKVPAYLNLSTEGQNRGGAAIGVGALLFWPALFVKGKEAEVKAGTLINAVISENRKITINPDYFVDPNTPSNSENNYSSKEMKEQICGEKPQNLNPNVGTPYPKGSSRYKKYLIKLQEWNTCMGIEN